MTRRNELQVLVLLKFWDFRWFLNWEDIWHFAKSQFNGTSLWYNVWELWLAKGKGAHTIVHIISSWIKWHVSVGAAIPMQFFPKFGMFVAKLFSCRFVRSECMLKWKSSRKYHSNTKSTNLSSFSFVYINSFFIMDLGRQKYKCRKQTNKTMCKINHLPWCWLCSHGTTSHFGRYA